MTEAVSVEIKGQIAWVTIDNPPVNATSTAVRAGLLAAVTRVQGCDLAVLRCAGKTFVAGGDMSEFDAPPQEPHLPDVVAAIEGSATPFVALMQGSVLGGGFEIAMACAFRIAKPKTKFGLPEVNMGLIPGAGGTQRAPRLLGSEMAIDLACYGKITTAEKLLEIGAIDAISDKPEALVQQFVGQSAVPVSHRTVASPPDEALRSKVQKFAKGRNAPGHNFDALSWATLPYAEAQPKERSLHLALRGSDESRALRHVFFAERAAAKPAQIKGVTPKKIEHVAIVGGGLMGCGIAATTLMAGYKVTLIEQNGDAADKAKTTITDLLDGALSRGKLSATAHDASRANLHTTTRYEEAGQVDLAIEAVFEDLATKRAVFAQLDRVMRPDTLLATNTSYLNPDEIFAGIDRPERCFGLHFFSPAHIMKLVEIIRASQSDKETLATGFAFARSLKKTPVLSGICDGFIGNRILSAYRRAAEYLLADGALPHEVDAAMRAFGMAMGPFEAQDQSGLQIAYANRRRQDAQRDPAERYVSISDQLCDLERFGRRSGSGWYRYDGGSPAPLRDPDVDSLIARYSAESGIIRRDFSEADIQAQLLAVMANEGARIVEEGIAENEATVDVVKTAGYGFPRWRGGPMHYAEGQGPEALRRTLTTMATASPGSWTRARRYT